MRPNIIASRPQFVSMKAPIRPNATPNRSHYNPQMVPMAVWNGYFYRIAATIKQYKHYKQQQTTLLLLFFDYGVRTDTCAQPRLRLRRVAR